MKFIQSCMPENVFMYRLMNDFKQTFARKFAINDFLRKIDFLNLMGDKQKSVGLVGDKLIFDLNTPTLMWLKRNE